MNFRIARAAFRTGSLLRRLVHEQGGETLGQDALVCYGAGYSGSSPALNARCSTFNKLEQARILREVLGVRAVEPMSSEEALTAMEENPALGELYPVLGRNIQHTRGRDIRLCLEPWQVEALRDVSDFFVPYRPSVAEWRTWIYRKRHLGSYRKVLQNPEDMRRVGRNYHNGFRFERVERQEVPEALKQLGREAIAALGLDFGAVDILETAPGTFVVLEVNSAPGVQDDRRAVIQRLAYRIVRWAQEGYPNATT